MSRLPTMLFYNTFFDDPYDLSWLDPTIRDAFVFDRSLYDDADAVIFHIPDLNFGKPTLEDVEKLKKPSGQLWVAWSKESAVNYPVQDDPAFMNRFDLVMSYKRSADVWDSYFPSRWQWQEALKHSPEPKTEKAPIVMFQSAGFNKSLRTEFASELMRKIQIDSYGRHLNNKTLSGEDRGRETKLATISRYKFCLSLENAIEEDYVTEKFFDPLLVGTVPIYRGAPNVANYAPAKHCFVNAFDFSSPRDLGAYLIYLSENDEAYQQYLAWRNEPLTPKFEKDLLDRDVDPFSKLVDIVRRTNC